MPNSDAALATLSALLSFSLCLAALHAAAARLPHITPLAAAASATAIMDPNMILAFIVGLFASAAVLLFITANSECAQWRATSAARHASAGTRM